VLDIVFDLAMATAHPMTLTQKILLDHALGLRRPWVEAGDILRISVDWTIASELAWNGMDRTYERLGRPALHDRNRFFLAVDHTVDPVTLKGDERTQKLVQLSRDFAKQSGIRHFYDANQTILHTKFYRDLVQPGEVILGADSHTSSHGGLGAFSIGLGGADVTAAMVLGETWIEVPDAIAVELSGTLPFGVTGKDVILATLGQLHRNTIAMERSVEYVGDAAHRLSTDARFTIANMTAEFGGLNGIFEADAVVAAWLARREGNRDDARYYRADEGAPYVDRRRIELNGLLPHVAKPFSPDNAFPVGEALGVPLQGCFIGACTTTEEELVLGALVLEQALKSHRPVESANRLVVPGSLSIQHNLEERGLWEIYRRAGFTVDPPGCSMCLGIASRRANPGETWLSSQNRNFENRMGRGSLAWLASAATVAASSLDMKIADPRPLLAAVDQRRFAALLGRDGGRPLPEVRVVDPEPRLVAQEPLRERQGATSPDSVLEGRVQLFGDNVDTDAIIPGEFCHLTDLRELGEHAFHHVRPGFAERVRAGQNIVVAGEGWGSGSSREHAVWALVGAGVDLVIARSYAFIHKRNLVNEGLPFMVIRDPQFYELAKEGATLRVELGRRTVTEPGSGRTFAAEPLSPIIDALRRGGGLVDAVKRSGKQVFAALAG
jgi:3-isopropylmalate dehydratase small subunit